MTDEGLGSGFARSITRREITSSSFNNHPYFQYPRTEITFIQPSPPQMTFNLKNKWQNRPCVSAQVERNVTRFLSLFQAFYAGIVLGIVGWFLSHCNDDLLLYPKARLIYTEVFAALGFIHACIFVLAFNTTKKWMTPLNIFWALVWFAAYGAMVEFDCSDNFEGWEEKFGPNFQACWSAATAFCFLSGFFYVVIAVFAVFTACWVKPAPQHPEAKRVSVESERPETSAV